MRAQPKPFHEYFRRRSPEPEDFTALPGYYTRRHLFNGVTFQLALATALAIGAFSARLFVVLLLTQAAFLAWLYFRARIVAEGLFVRREPLKHTFTSGENAEVRLEVINSSDLIAGDLIIEELFGPSRNPHVILGLTSGDLPARSARRLTYQRVCDGGMGRHTIGPCLIRMTDPLGIFEFRVPIEECTEIEVQPQVSPIPTLPVRGSTSASGYGTHEISTRGLSVNFSGVRPYTPGDPLRHISWRLSSKGQGLLVKEFERVVNVDVTVLLNLHSLLLTGYKAASTWEFAKDAALAVIQQQLDLGNSVAFATDHVYYEPGVGREHFHTLARRITTLDPCAGAPEPDNESYGFGGGARSGARGGARGPARLLLSHLERIPAGSTLIYVTPYHEREIAESFATLRELHAQGRQIIAVLIDTNSFWPEIRESLSASADLHAIIPTHGIEETIEDFRVSGIIAYRVRNQTDLMESFRIEERA
jgi:uncharacterized protein (DUF58 family)